MRRRDFNNLVVAALFAPIVPATPDDPQYDLMADLSEMMSQDYAVKGNDAHHVISCSLSGLAYLHRTGCLEASIKNDGTWVLWFRAEGYDACSVGNAVWLGPTRSDVGVIRVERETSHLIPEGTECLRYAIVGQRCFNVDLTDEGRKIRNNEKWYKGLSIDYTFDGRSGSGRKVTVA